VQDQSKVLGEVTNRYDPFRLTWIVLGTKPHIICRKIYQEFLCFVGNTSQYNLDN